MSDTPNATIVIEENSFNHISEIESDGWSQPTVVTTTEATTEELNATGSVSPSYAPIETLADTPAEKPANITPAPIPVLDQPQNLVQNTVQTTDSALLSQIQKLEKDLDNVFYIFSLIFAITMVVGYLAYRLIKAEFKRQVDRKVRQDIQSFKQDYEQELEDLKQNYAEELQSLKSQQEKQGAALTKQGVEFHVYKIFEQAEQAYSRKNYSQTIELYTKFLGYTETSEAYCNRGNAKAKSGDLAGALDDYNASLNINPSSVEALKNRGITKAKLNDLEGAIGDYDAAITIQPDYASSYYSRGNAKLRLGDTNGAIADYDAAIELKSEYPQAFNNRGAAKAELQDHAGAIEDYNKALELDPTHAGAFYNRACNRALLKQNHESILSDLSQAIRLDDKSRTMAQTDSDLSALRDLPEFRTLVGLPVKNVAVA